MKFSKGAHGAPFFIGTRAAGFSLVELMIVVAIIGLLSSVAIPNFRKFQARSRTTEAKLQLAAIYTAEAGFYGTYHMYQICLNDMGYDPTEYRSSRYYSVGFTNSAALDTSPHVSAVNHGMNPVDCPQTMPATNDKTYFVAGTGVGSAIATSAHIPLTSLGDQTVTDMTFIAGAGGIIYKDFTAATDASAFTINQSKVIVTVRNGY